MLSNLYGNSSSSHGRVDKIDTSLFVRELYLRTNYIESDIEEDIEMKNQLKIQTLLDPNRIREAASKKVCCQLIQ